MATPYGTITADVLSVIKAPPLLAPTSSYTYDATVVQNDINGKLFQFKARFIYDDDEKSVFSPVAKAYTVGWMFTIYGYNTPTLLRYNKVDIDVDIPNDPTLMKMDIVVREGNYGIWYLVDTVDISSSLGATYTYNFYNNKVLIALDQVDANRPYDYVPLKAGAQEVIDNNRIIYGDITEGYDNDIDLDITLTRNYGAYSSDVQTNPSVFKTSSIHFYIDFSNYDKPATLDITIVGDDITNQYIYSHTEYWDEGVQVPALRTVTEILDQFIEDMADDPVLESVYRSGNFLHIVFHNFIERPDVLFVVAEHQEVRKTLKDGAKQFLGVVYGDKYGRTAPVKRSSDTEIVIPFTTETNGPGDKESVRLDYQINHTPPDWAYTWRWVYGGSSIAWFQRFAVRTHEYSDKSVWREDGYTKIAINSGINDVRDSISNYRYPNYIWEEGDRLRIIGTRPVTGVEDVNDQTVTLLTQYLDFEILRFDGIYIYVDDWVNYSGAPDVDDIDLDILVEIYRTRKDADENLPYWGIGEVHDITNPGEVGRVHADASGTLTIGECFAYEMPLVALFGDETFHVPAATTTTTTTTSSTTYAGPVQDVLGEHYGIRCFPVFSMYQSPYRSDSDVVDKGELHIVNEDYEEKRLNSLAFSGPFIGRTNINELNRFDYDNFVELEDKNGRIYGLKQVGYTLKVLQESKNTSIYIQREVYTDAAGNSQLIMTDKVLGSKRPHEEDYGTIFSNSIVKIDRDIFYYDIYSERIVRDSPNGQEAVSLVALDSYIRAKSRALLSSGVSNVDVIGGADSQNGMVYFTFIDGNTPANNETIGFHVDENHWVGNYSFIPELYSGIGDNVFVSFKDGKLYVHDSDSVNRNYFYGTQYHSEVHIVSNVDPRVIKTWDAIEVASNKLWTIASDDSIVIDPSTRYPHGMKSKILSGDWEEYEEVFRAAFNYDMLTGGGSSVDVYNLHNGRELRGRNMLIKLKNEDTTEVNLVMVRIVLKVSN